MISKFDLKKYLVPSDTIYFVVIFLGLFILVFLNDLPVRLIGACMALLSGVVLVMNLSTRLKDRVETRRPAPSQPVELSVKVRKDDSGTRYVFDDFESNFGGDDVLVSAEAEAQLPREKSAPQRMRFDDTDASSEPTVVTRRNPAFKNEASPARDAFGDDDSSADFSDDISGMRIKRRQSEVADTTNQATSSQTAAADSRTASAQGSSANRSAATGGTAAPSGALPSDKAPAITATQSTGATQGEATTKGPKAQPQQQKQKNKGAKTLPIPETEQADIVKTTPLDDEQSTSDARGVNGQKSAPATIAAASQTLDVQQAKPGTNKKDPESVASSDESSDNSPSIPEAVPLPRVDKSSETDEIAGAEGTAMLGAENTPYRNSDPQQNSRQRQLQLAMANLIDDVEHPGDEEPRKEFDYLLSRVLMVIRSMMNARTAVFFWVNLEQDELVMETRITDAADLFRNQRKYPMGRDIVSQIAKSGRPEILTEIKPSAQSDLIPYYTKPAGTTSFVGVPVFLNHTVIGVLCADSTQDDAYDEITIGSLGHFTKLISGLTQSYTGKYDLLQSSRTLEALTHFRSLVNKPRASMQHIASALVESSSTIVEAQTIGVVLFDREKEDWTIHNISSERKGVEKLAGSVINTENALITRTIFRGTTTLSNPIPHGVCRYHTQESALPNGFFAAVPLKSTSNCYGALFVEGHSSELTERDISILETIGEQTGIILEQLHVQKLLKKSALMDEGTGLLNSTAFIHRLDEEVIRARDNKVPMVVVLVAIDRYGAIEHQLGHADKEEIFLHVLSLLRKVVRSYDVLGRVDDNIIAIAMSGTRDTEAQLWAERLRKEVAISVKEINRKRYTVTVSIGLAKAVDDDNAESILTNAGRAMELAAAKTNNVMVYA